MHILRLLVAALVALGALAAHAPPAAARGGWAVGSLDSVPAARAGSTEEVGFTIRAHGVTPTDVSGIVGIELRGPDGELSFFEAVPGAEVGHYTAAVTFPEVAGDYSWSIRMGWYPDQDLGTLNVVGGPDATTVSWPTLRWGALGLATALAGLAVLDAARSRRRTTVAA